jgi:CubicO group peptidase (beta-lactamase class C family)
MDRMKLPTLAGQSALLALLPTLGAQETAQSTDLTARIEAIRAEAGVPALGGALITLEGEPEVWVTGTRRAGGTEKVAVDDLWHLGSCTKSMTATLLALLVERGDLKWETPLGDWLPDLMDDIDLDYGDVTLVELCGHRAGLAPNPDVARLFGLRTSTKTLVEQREEILRVALSAPPVHPPRGKLLYSNSGFILAGHLAERATGKSWEELMQELLFRPLGMTSAGFGPPGVGETGVTQPRGHSEAGEPAEPGPLADNPAALGPAGTVHASLADWAKYARLHLQGARGDVKVGALTLPRAAFTRIHTAVPGPGDPYGFGWVMHTRDWAGGDGATLWHNGSNTMWYCELWLGLANGVAVLSTTNQATNAAKGATGKVATLLVQEFQRRKK